MSKQETEKILSQLSSRGIKPGLERMKKLMHALGDPQKKFRAIHVTGSNGKGSVCAMLESILHCARYRVGLYTSPHLTEVCERIRLNKENISSPEFYWFVNKVWSYAKSINIEEDLTYFEMLTAVAFCYFAESKVEIAVIEVGLGGRLDATNIIPSPEVCVITNISLEHTDILGKSIEKIAWEKAGIVKKNSTCVTAASGAALGVIREICFQQDACLVPARSESNLESLVEICALKGEFQKENILVVMKVIEILRENGWEIAQEKIFSGLQETFLLGRFQKMLLPIKGKSTAVPVLLDGAHNPAAIRALTAAIHQSTFRDKPCILIFNALRDKDILKMVQTLAENLNILHLLIPILDTERSNEPSKVGKIFLRSKAKCSIKTFAGVEKCWNFLSKRGELIAEADWILATGSLYLVGETLRADFVKPMAPVPLKEYA